MVMFVRDKDFSHIHGDWLSQKERTMLTVLIHNDNEEAFSGAEVVSPAADAATAFDHLVTELNETPSDYTRNILKWFQNRRDDDVFIIVTGHGLTEMWSWTDH